MSNLSKSEFVEVFYNKISINETRQYALCTGLLSSCLNCPFNATFGMSCITEMNEMFTKFKQEHPELTL